MPGVDPDEELVKRVADGDPLAIETFVTRKLPRMVSLAHRLLGDAGDAEDVAQEVMIKAWRQAKSWRPGAGKFDSWMHRVALNLCYDRLRRRREDPMAEPPEQSDPAAGAEAGLMTLERSRRVSVAVATLPPRQRQALVLCHYQELSNVQAAGLMRISVEAIESLLSRGRRTLRAALTDVNE